MNRDVPTLCRLFRAHGQSGDIGGAEAECVVEAGGNGAGRRALSVPSISLRFTFSFPPKKVHVGLLSVCTAVELVPPFRIWHGPPKGMRGTGRAGDRRLWGIY